MAQRGIILFGHGSRDPLWRKPIEAVAVRVHALEKYLLGPGDESRELRLARVELEVLTARYGPAHLTVVEAEQRRAMVAEDVERYAETYRLDVASNPGAEYPRSSSRP